jgi:hypothetical protein
MNTTSTHLAKQKLEQKQNSLPLIYFLNAHKIHYSPLKNKDKKKTH